MKILLFSATLSLVVLPFLIALTACQSDKHTMVVPKPGEVVVCSKCYDEIAKVKRRIGHRGPVRTENVSVHQCPECNTEMSIYSENGVLMVKCAACAPEGVPCDMCLPRYEQ